MACSSGAKAPLSLVSRAYGLKPVAFERPEQTQKQEQGKGSFAPLRMTSLKATATAKSKAGVLWLSLEIGLYVGVPSVRFAQDRLCFALSGSRA
jgi:hypothetical protein